MIRLATAHAKGRLSREVLLEDANAAIELVQFAYFKKIIVKPKKGHQEQRSDGETDEDEEMDLDEEVLPKRKKREAPGDVYEFEDDEQPEMRPKKEKRTTQVEKVVELTDDKFKQFKKWLNEEFRKSHTEKLVLKDIESALEDKFTREEVGQALDRMQNDNQVMVADGDVILI